MSYTDDYLEAFGTDDLILMANDILRDYNKAREIFCNNVRHYYHQSITNSYYNEDDLENSLEHLKHLKEQYKRMADILKSRGIRRCCNEWHDNNNHLYTLHNILHSA